MSEERYRNLYAAVSRLPHAALVMNILDKALVGIVAGIYVFIFFWSFVSQFTGAPVIAFGPMTAFIFVTILRRGLNFRRPYEVFGTAPLLEKDTEGRSFPSRHVASAFAIAVSLLLWDIRLAVLIAVLGIVIAFLRVAGGVHFIRDVVAGAMIGGGIGFAAVAIFII